MVKPSNYTILQLYRYTSILFQYFLKKKKFLHVSYVVIYYMYYNILYYKDFKNIMYIFERCFILPVGVVEYSVFMS